MTSTSSRDRSTFMSAVRCSTSRRGAAARRGARKGEQTSAGLQTNTSVKIALTRPPFLSRPGCCPVRLLVTGVSGKNDFPAKNEGRPGRDSPRSVSAKCATSKEFLHGTTQRTKHDEVLCPEHKDDVQITTPFAARNQSCGNALVPHLLKR
jgi:hypothetical protein